MQKKNEPYMKTVCNKKKKKNFLFNIPYVINNLNIQKTT